MKKVKSCETENCIPTPSSCIQWNGGDIDFLGICNGDWLNNILWEIITKLQEVAGEDLSGFDIDSILDLCSQKAPQEVNLLSILNVLRKNQICMKDYLDNLQETVDGLSAAKAVTVDLKCFADFDNLGNSLAITRESLDQLVINNLCSQKQRLDTVEGKILGIQSEIDNINADTTVNEVSFPTCINGDVLPTSTQVRNIATELCSLETDLGKSADIASALSKVPASWATKFGGGPSMISGWDLSPANFMEHYANLVLIVARQEARITTIENTCCGVTCDAIKIGIIFTVNDDGTVDMLFSSGAGTYIPTGFEDCGTTMTFEDKNGLIFTPSLNGTPISQEGTVVGVNISSLASGIIKVNINSKFCLSDNAGNVVLTCQGCFSEEFENNSGCCVLTNTGSVAQTIIYKTTLIS